VLALIRFTVVELAIAGSADRRTFGGLIRAAF
jgi:hypothetical protein